MNRWFTPRAEPPVCFPDAGAEAIGKVSDAVGISFWPPTHFSGKTAELRPISATSTALTMPGMPGEQKGRAHHLCIPFSTAQADPLEASFH